MGSSIFSDTLSGRSPEFLRSDSAAAVARWLHLGQVLLGRAALAFPWWSEAELGLVRVAGLQPDPMRQRAQPNVGASHGCPSHSGRSLGWGLSSPH